jgi:ribosomal protein S25
VNDTSGRHTAGDRIRTVTTAGVAGLAVGAFLLSYDALHQLARTSHVPAPLAWLWPLIVDGFILVASLAVLDAVHTGQRARYPWLLVLAFSTLSVTFNVLHAPHDLVAQLVAAIPPLTLVLSFELLMRQIHHRLRVTPATARVPAAPTPHAARDSDDVARIVAATAAVPEASAATSASPSSQVASTTKATRSPRAVTQARAEAVLDDCNRTGQPLTTAVLAERLGISPGYARRLLRDLNNTPTPGEATAVDADAERPVTGLRAVRP